MVFISAISIKHTFSLTESSEILVQSSKIQLQLDQLLSDVKDAESGQRGYIITKDTALLSDYRSSFEKINKSFIILKNLTSVQQHIQYNLDSLNSLINLRFDLLAKSLVMVAEPNMNVKLLDENMFEGKKLMKRIQSHIDEIQDKELIYFNQLEKEYEYENKFTPVFTLLIFVFSLIIFILSFIKILRDFEKLNRTNQNLIISTESFKQAEKIGHFCITQWDLESDKIKFSDNLYLLLGCEPQSFEASMENFLKFVHPDDKHIVSTAAEKVVNENKAYSHYYRIIRKDDELRYYKSISKFIPDENSKMHISIITDITQQHLINLSLEERNRDLEQSIKELESFNRVASHDLQEPLRKIQTLISRISVQDISAISESGQEQIKKIEESAKRMRILIDDLLLFSRTNKLEKEFHLTDLNYILENAKQELAQHIDDKKAKLFSDKLPVLNVIGFQIQQLFINLIDNSLKYNRSGVNPVIKIEYEKINDLKHPSLISNKKKFHKISVIDNGLGFEQKYAENIFNLFNRLHDKSEYPGSGIGLSICKKIVENHNGFILAQGFPDIGSTFSIYLPD